MDDGFLYALFEGIYIIWLNVHYSSKYLYKVVLDRFNDKIQNSTEIPYIQPQMSGTCVFSGPSAYIRVKLKEEKAHLLTLLYTGKALLSYFTTRCIKIKLDLQCVDQLIS